MKLKLIPLLVASAFAVTGCATTNLEKGVDVAHSKAEKVATSAIKDNFSDVKAQPLLVKAKSSWLGGKSIPVSFDAELPGAFRKSYTFNFPRRVNLTTAASIIMNVTNIPVNVTADASVNPLVFMAGAQQLAQAAGGVNTGGASNGYQQGGQVGSPTGSLGGLSALSLKDTDNSIELNFDGAMTLSDVLDRICAKASASWKYEKGSVSIYRVEEKTFAFHASPGTTAFNSSAGVAGSSQTGTTGGSSGSSSSSSFTTDSNSKIASNYSVWADIKKDLETILSPVGKVSVNESLGQITVKDTKAVVDHAGKIIDNANAVLTRQVKLRVDVVTVQVDKNIQQGLDLNAVFNHLNSSLNPTWRLSLGTPGSLVDGNAAQFGLSFVGSGGTGLTSTMSGSGAFIKALGEMNKIVSQTTSGVSTLNRRPTTTTVTEQTSYVAATTPGTSTAGGSAGAPGLTPGQVTTGFVMNLLPTIKDNGRVEVQASINISELKQLATFTSGSGASSQSVQSPSVSSNGLQQTMALRPGETMVLAGFDREDGQYDKRNLTESMDNPITGSKTGKSKKQVTVVLITPYIEESL